MKVQVDPAGSSVHVTVSRRNLTHLLAALDAAEGRLTPYLVRRVENDIMLYIYAEEDEDHYSDRVPGAGFEGLIKLIHSDEEVPVKT